MHRHGRTAWGFGAGGRRAASLVFMRPPIPRRTGYQSPRDANGTGGLGYDAGRGDGANSLSSYAMPRSALETGLRTQFALIAC
jgi:hypothetical protein